MKKLTRIRVQNKDTEIYSVWMRICSATIGGVKKKYRLDGTSDGHGNRIGWKLGWIENDRKLSREQENFNSRYRIQHANDRIVNVYIVDRAYGGPEEGGWYYDRKELARHFKLPSKRYAKYFAAQLEKRWPYKGNLKRDYYRGNWYSIEVEKSIGASEKLTDWYE